MKNFKITLLTLLLTSVTFAQMGDPNLSNKLIANDLEARVETTENDVTYLVRELETTEEYTPVILDPEDKYKLNQDIIYLPTQVKKTIKLDHDFDKSFDKEIKFNYIKSDNFDLDFTLTKTGIIINTDNNKVSVSKIWDKTSKVMFYNSKNGRIKNEGLYTVEFSNGEKIDITITNYKIK